MAGYPSGLRVRRRELVGTLWLRGFSVREIAELIRDEAAKKVKLKGADKTTYVTVHRDIKAMQKEWAARLDANIADKRNDAVARLMSLIRQAWQDFMNKSDKLRPQYMTVILNAEGQVAKIEGTLAPTALVGAEGEPLVPPVLIFKMPDGVEIKPPTNGNRPQEALSLGDDGH